MSEPTPSAVTPEQQAQILAQAMIWACCSGVTAEGVEIGRAHV